jgi:hypothetical protein
MVDVDKHTEEGAIPFERHIRTLGDAPTDAVKHDLIDTLQQASLRLVLHEAWRLFKLDIEGSGSTPSAGINSCTEKQEPPYAAALIRLSCAVKLVQIDPNLHHLSQQRWSSSPHMSAARLRPILLQLLTEQWPQRFVFFEFGNLEHLFFVPPRFAFQAAVHICFPLDGFSNVATEDCMNDFSLLSAAPGPITSMHTALVSEVIEILLIVLADLARA